MSYENALEAAGATIHNSRAFGSYQGDMWIHLTYNGTTGWLCISYGSCGGCDSYEAWHNDIRHQHPDYYENWDAYPTQEELADFGRGYLDSIMTTEEAIVVASERLDWDMEAKEMIEFIESTNYGK